MMASHRSSTKCTSRHAKRLVQHDYHDHSQEVWVKKRPQQDGGEDDPYDTESISSNVTFFKKKTRRGPRGGVKKPFPIKLHMLLESGEHSDVIHWQPHGRCFYLKNPNKFLKIVMPLHFRQSKLTSFQRQLNLYGFSRLYSGNDKGSYYHELFLRDRPHLCKRMIRMRIKGNGTKAGSNPRSEPNFYLMPPVSGKVLSSSATKKVKVDDVPSSIVLQKSDRPRYVSVEAVGSMDSTQVERMPSLKTETSQHNDFAIEDLAYAPPNFVSSASETDSIDGSILSTRTTPPMEQDPLHFLDYTVDRELKVTIVPGSMGITQETAFDSNRRLVNSKPDPILSFYNHSLTKPSQSSFTCTIEEQLYL